MDGINDVVTGNDKPLCLKVETFARALPKVSSWNNTQLSGSGAQCIELPSTGPFDFGNIASDNSHDRESDRDRQKVSGVSIRIRVDIIIDFRGGSPHVIVWFMGVSSQGNDYRRRVAAENLDTNGFTMRLTTWCDTRIDWMSAGWFAYESE